MNKRLQSSGCKYSQFYQMTVCTLNRHRLPHTNIQPSLFFFLQFCPWTDSDQLHNTQNILRALTFGSKQALSQVIHWRVFRNKCSHVVILHSFSFPYFRFFLKKEVLFLFCLIMFPFFCFRFDSSFSFSYFLMFSSQTTIVCICPKPFTFLQFFFHFSVVFFLQSPPKEKRTKLSTHVTSRLTSLHESACQCEGRS